MSQSQNDLPMEDLGRGTTDESYAIIPVTSTEQSIQEDPIVPQNRVPTQSFSDTQSAPGTQTSLDPIVILITMDDTFETCELVEGIKKKFKDRVTNVKMKDPSQDWLASTNATKSIAELRQIGLLKKDFYKVAHSDEGIDVMVFTDIAEAERNLNGNKIPVVMFCGHADKNGFSSYQLHDLARFTKTCEATIVGFLGCCVGRVREYDLVQITHDSGWTAICGAPDRICTKEDILESTFVKAAVYFSRLLNLRKQKYKAITDKQRHLARFALLVAETASQSVKKSPFVFFNDSDEQSSLQQWRELVNDTRLSMIQSDLEKIARYHTWVCEDENKLVHKVQCMLKEYAGNWTKMHEAKLVELKQYLMLDTLESWHSALKKKLISTRTLDCLQRGSLKELDPVSLAIVMYRGMCGELLFSDVIKVMANCLYLSKPVADYNIIATALVATWEKIHFVPTPHPQERLELGYWSDKSEKMYQFNRINCFYTALHKRIAQQSYFDEIEEVIKVIQKLHDLPPRPLVLEFPELESFDLRKYFVFETKYEQCTSSSIFWNLWHSNTSILVGSVHSICEKMNLTELKSSTETPYSSKMFYEALCQLCRHIDTDTVEEDWGIKTFVLSDKKGKFQIFPVTESDGFKGREIHLTKFFFQNLKLCRFVYVYKEFSGNWCRGLLYYTDVHYWTSLALLLLQPEELKQLKSIKDVQTKINDIEKIVHNRRRRAELIRKDSQFIYPFICIGFLEFQKQSTRSINLNRAVSSDIFQMDDETFHGTST